MPTWLSVILEIIKITVPALIVFITVLHLFRTYLDKQYQLKSLEFRHQQQNVTVPLRLQAYERLSLFCERISIPNLVLRLREEDQTAAGLRLAMLVTIQKEFEYNITQQVYVSDQLWQIIKVSRDHTVNVINGIAEEVDPKSPSQRLSSALLEYADKEQTTSLDKALLAIKKEASSLM